MRNRSCFTEEEMGYGRQSRQNRKENPVGNWTFRLRKMQKNLPRHPKQKEDLRLLENGSTSALAFFVFQRMERIGVKSKFSNRSMGEPDLFILYP
jgi:hypothetical protein